MPGLHGWVEQSLRFLKNEYRRRARNGGVRIQWDKSVVRRDHHRCRVGFEQQIGVIHNRVIDREGFLLDKLVDFVVIARRPGSRSFIGAHLRFVFSKQWRRYKHQANTSDACDQ